jgi:hypothetical protein
MAGEEEESPMFPLRTWNLIEIAQEQHEKGTILIVKELLQKIRTVIRTHPGTRQFVVSVSSRDPAFAYLDLQQRRADAQRLLAADLPEILVRLDYEHCWYGDLPCCTARRPRHRLVATVTLAAED